MRRRLAQFPGERAIRRFVPRGDAVLVTTVIPRDANTCLRAPPGGVYFPNRSADGRQSKRPILDLNNDAVEWTTTIWSRLEVLPPRRPGLLLDTDISTARWSTRPCCSALGDADFLFLSGGSDQQTIRIAGPEDLKTGRLSWRELDDTN